VSITVTIKRGEICAIKLPAITATKYLLQKGKMHATVPVLAVRFPASTVEIPAIRNAQYAKPRFSKLARGIARWLANKKPTVEESSFYLTDLE